MSNPIFNIGENIFYYNRWNNEIEKGEIIHIRESKYNWDYNIRYQIYSDLTYYYWIEEKYIGRDEQVLYKYLI